MASKQNPRHKIYGIVSEVAEKYHFTPLSEGPAGSGKMHSNLVLMTLTYLLDRNHILAGEPGWGKTTVAKILASKLSGLPYDLYDAVEMRGNPQKYEEKIVARPDYGALAQGQERVRWQGSFGSDVLIGDEINRLSLDAQDAILQGLETHRWNYLNATLFEGKKPAFFTMNERTGNHEVGLLPALRDRMDIQTEEGFFTTMVLFDYKDAKSRVTANLCRPDFTQSALDALAIDYAKFKGTLQQRLVQGYLTHEEKADIQGHIRSLELDNDAMLFLQAAMAEINHSVQYGSKRASDPISTDTHDQSHAGIYVKNSFSPRTAMAAEDYAKGLAWFLGSAKASLDQVLYVLPYVFVPKAVFTDDYAHRHGNDVRQTSMAMHLATTLMREIHARYVTSVQPMKNLIAKIQIAKIQSGALSESERKKLDPNQYDHPLMKDLIIAAKEDGEKAFYE
ncbi:MAG: AAA family ATPase [Candidatus Micrarchaeota archaeon]